MPSKFDTSVRFLDPQDMLAALGRRTGQRRSESERVSYWRRPDKGRFAGWVLWADTQPGKRDDMMSRGFTPLFKFGRVHDGNDKDGERFKEYGPWGAILCHPEGPRAFPIEQLITYRWYSEEGLRFSCNGELPLGKRPGQLFPQLVEYVQAGNSITEYTCSECESISYLQPVHLARHLRNSHNWDRQDVLAWGNQLGIDFSREFKPRKVALEIGAKDLLDAPPAPEHEPAVFEVPVVQAEVPDRESLAESIEAESGRKKVAR